MKTRTKLLAALNVLLLAACGGGSDGTPFAPVLTSPPGVNTLGVSSVAVTAASSIAVPGWDVPLFAAQLDASGNEIGTLPVTWTSSDPTIAAVLSDGYRAVLRANQLGQVTITAYSRGFPTVSGSIDIVVRATSPRVLASMRAGGRHTCASAKAGPAVCWGSNDQGQLGDGASTSSSTPVEIRGQLGFLGSVSAGARFSCGADWKGASYCWGDNAFGQLGDGSRTSRSSPGPVNSLSPGYVYHGLIAAGARHGCSTDGGDDVSYCWGDNSSGQLGIGTLVASTTPVAVRSNYISFQPISAGSSHTCGLSSNVAQCWGSNSHGQLGDGTTIDRTTPTVVLANLLFGSVDAGDKHTCAVAKGSVAYCWGDNSNGQLGNGTLAGSVTPVTVSGGLLFAMIDAGTTHTCGVTTGGAAYCWGSNTNGQLGNGSTTSSNVPVAVAGGLAFSTITVGELHTCGLTTGDIAYCWGSNSDGQLGNGTTIDKVSPVKVLGQS